MFYEETHLNVKEEALTLASNIIDGNLDASHHLARLIEADTKGVFQPFAQAFAARLHDHLKRWAELGIPEPDAALEEAIYELLKFTAVDWDGYPSTGRPGEEA